MDSIFAAVAPIAMMTLIGFVLARTGRPVEGDTLRFLVADIGSPALVFTALLKTNLSGAMLFHYAGAGVAAMVGFGCIGYTILRISGLSLRTYLPSMMCANTGNLGMPLALYAFGPAGVGYAAVIHTINAITNFTVGQAIASGSSNWKAIVTSPTLLAAIAGFLAVALQISLPPWLRNSLELLSSLAVPLMLLMLGTSLATIRATSLQRAFALSALRIGMGMAVGFALAWAFGLSGVPRAVFVLQAAMPVAVYNYLFALAGRSDAAGVASLVVVSTALSIVTIPALLAMLL